MKTEKYFNEYNEYVTGQNVSINELEKEKHELKLKIDDDKAKYKELVANAEDDKADELYSTFDINEKKLKALNKRLETKKEVFQEAKRKKAIELIKYQADLPNLYQNVKDELISKIKAITEEYNKVIDEIDEINNKYDDEFNRFVGVYDRLELYDDEEAKKELRNYYRSDKVNEYINGSDLPYEYRKKLVFRGANNE
ncbi:hypothetical protein [Staphylococcus lugdunensis]|uniref:Pathogenicity island family protein n=1 Tax=Staphylococcus lugdunensis TaxID=28035 RepID=A0ABD4EGK6_STALU|nr:hypothetical protein [Staphylococcus lugdunensis]KXA38885.1 pathogenicity island family protein [Staphylococcus lugdunensis]MCO7040711.1 pathogenicity island protein [Staphylococcus lugdunensis]QEX29660.1 pathogenicity island protein [Staphylococcus lugdunensis]